MDLKNGDCVRLSVGHASVVAPVWVMPGQAPYCITALLGFGRRAAGSIGNHVGIDFYPLTGIAGPVTLHKVSGHVELASTVHHNLLMDTPPEILRHGTLADFVANPHFAANERARRAPLSRRATRSRRLGHERRLERLHRLQRLRHRLPGREQYSRGR